MLFLNNLLLFFIIAFNTVLSLKECVASFKIPCVACSGASLIKSELCQCIQIRKWLTLKGIFCDHQVQPLLKQGRLEQVGQDSVHLDFVNISRSQNWFQDRCCCEFWYGDRASLWEHNSCGEKILKSQVVQISSVTVTKKNQNNNPTQPHTKKKSP